MSRRKQAKPRPIFAYEEEGQTEDVFVPIAQTNGHSQAGSLEDEHEDPDDFGEFAPLVMDTPSQDEDVSREPQTVQPPSHLSIKPSLDLPKPIAQTVRPEPLKQDIDEAPVYNQNSIINNNNNEVDIATKERIDSVASVSSVASVATSSNDGSTSPGSRPSNSGNQEELMSSTIRRGSKASDPEMDENEENLDYDSDFDDLEELLSELIKHKILPVSDEDGEKFICPVCSCSLLNLHDLTVHIRSHNSPATGTQSNSCKICGKVLSSQSSLDRHMLVHSGERPFLCKICNMSFTTNGNMHRHSRIHTKEENLNALGSNKFQMRRGKSAWRQRINNFLNQANSPVSDRMKSFQGNMSQDILQSLPNHSQQSVFGRPSENLPPLVPGMKRQYSGTDLSPDWQIPFKRQSLSSDSDVKDISPRKYNYQMMPVKGEQPMEIKQEENSDKDDKGDKEVLHCPVCPKTFLCKYGLETHLDTHPEYSTPSHCGMCNITFKNSQKLRLHRLISHSEEPKEGSDEEMAVKQMENIELKVGFHDLSFIDFSVEKFSLIAKYYFEKNVRTTSSAYLNFTCKSCSKAFPCETSLILHSYTHSKDKCTQCPLCECDFANVNEFHTHMLKHLSDKAFEEIRPSLRGEKGDEDVTPDRLTQHDFLAMFLLKEDEEHGDQKTQSTKSKKEPVKPIKTEKNTNDEYFAKLGQSFAPGIAPLFNQFPVFPPGYQPSLDDFHKMLQIATNMNMLPSMGPQLLRQGRGDTPISAHTSPSKLPLHLPPRVSIPTPMPSPAHSQNGFGLLSTPTHDDRILTGGPEKEINEIKMMNSGPFPCKYCDTVFPNYKSLKVHIRTHLGLSPYQCNLCVYSSSDKSSLIRHIRTHSGERPFQCLICDFAFTTRANCERHIRKKHHVSDKDEVEKTIYLNKFSLTSGSTVDNFHSPDTICKYCGVDFKFFRALKHHLRSHSSCRQKPYQCQLCAMGFCTKSNCLRHVQKMHPEISDNRIETHITVIEQGVTDDVDNDSVSDDGIPMYTDESRTPTPLDMRSANGTPQPPAAHSTPKPEGILGRDSRHASPSRHVSPSSRHISPNRHMSPSRHISPLSHISPTQSTLVKTEPVENSDEAPLDFSIKSSSESPRLIIAENQSPKPVSSRSHEAPMDLSVKKHGIFNPIAIAPKPFPQTYPQMIEGSLMQCIYCPLGYSSLGALERHMRQQHTHLVGSENPALTAHLSTMPIFNTEGKLLLPPKNMSPFQYNPNKAMYPTRPIKPKVTGSVTLQNLQDKIKQNLKREIVSRSPSGSETDLSSVTKMLDATDQLNFQAFFNTDQNSANISVATLSKLSTPRLPNILRRPGIQISLEHCKAINRELDNLQREGDVDEAALSQVREMALSVKEEVVNSSTTPAGNLLTTIPGNRTVSPTTSHNEMEDENSGDGSSSLTKFDGDKSDNAPVKKKRNSYADSPHKLSCPYCPRAFPWVSSLTRHLLTHTGQKPFKCPRCPVTFSTKSNRERHLIRKHGVNMLDPLSRQTMDRPYKCPLCVFSSFSTQSNLLKHYRDRHNGANLPESIADIERMSPTAIRAATLEMESRAAANPPLEESAGLDMTNEEYEDDLDNSVDSSEKMDDDSIPYTEMDMQDDVNQLDNGMEKSAHVTSSLTPVMTERTEEDRPRIAPHLLMAMPDMTRMRHEEAMEKLRVKDEQVDESENGDERSESPNTMRRNIEKIIAEQKALIDQKTQMEMKIQSEIRAQIDGQRKTDENPSLSPVSTDTPFDSPILMGGDLMKSLGGDLLKPFTGSAERVINPERDNYDVDKITACWKCNEMFPSRKILIRHLKEHNIDLPFKCYLCDASYELRVDCLTHQDMVHTSDWKILKEKNKVGIIDQFAIHMDKVVENNCNKLDSGSILEIPGSGIDDSKMEVISADYMQRKVYCSLCPKRFWSLQDLRRHMRSHTGERPFECDICQKRFTLKHSMMRHRKKHVGAPPPVFDDDDDSVGTDDKGSKTSSYRLTPSRNLPILPYPGTYSLGSSLASSITSTLSSDSLTFANTFLFSQGLSGGRMTLGGSSIGSLISSSTATVPRPSTSINGSSSLNGNKGVPSLSEAPLMRVPKLKASVPTLDSVKKEFLDCNADMLHNLLGVESSAIEKMLDSADSQSAAQYLGLTEASG